MVGWEWLGPYGRPGRSITLPSDGYEREQAICRGCGGIVFYLWHIFEYYHPHSIWVGAYGEEPLETGRFASPMWMHADLEDHERCSFLPLITKGGRL